jgi:hypothetical protein
MGQHLITIVVSADEPDFTHAVDHALEALVEDGYNPTEVRVSSDAGESSIPIAVPPEEPPEEPPPEDPTAKSESKSTTSKK